MRVLSTPLISWSLGLAIAAFAGCSSGDTTAPIAEGIDIPPVFGKGNYAPSGAHYNLNIIGTKLKSAAMDDNSGHRIFVLLFGKTRILLCESGLGALAIGDCPPDPVFAVLDANGTDGDGAKFALPNPDPTNSGTTMYSVYARALGKPGGHAENQTCGVLDPDPTIAGDEEEICGEAVLVLDRRRGKSKFEDVSKCLLYIWADLNDDGRLERVPLFDTRLQDYFWEYDNNGLKLAQLRFYPLPTTVPETVDAGTTC
jgi:hypothetical protein